MDRLSRKIDVHRQPLMQVCKADCHGPMQLNIDKTMEQACGDPSGRIIRGDLRFKRYGFHF